MPLSFANTDIAVPCFDSALLLELPSVFQVYKAEMESAMLSPVHNVMLGHACWLVASMKGEYMVGARYGSRLHF